MASSRFPRIVGFDVPALVINVKADIDPPIVALLDIAPSRSWLLLFEREVRSLTGELDIATVTISDTRIFFYGSKADGRRLATAVSDLVDRVSLTCVDERMSEVSTGHAAGPSPSDMDRRNT